MATPANTLTTAAVGFLPLSEKQLRAVRIYILDTGVPSMATNPNTLVGLATTAGYMNMSVKQQMAVETYLLSIGSGGGGGGAGGLAGIGSPEGVVTANAGATYADVTDPNSPSLWVKATGTGNTGWSQLIA